MKLAIYTSSHGYGHTSRSYELALSLVERESSLKVGFNSAVHDSFFRGQDHPRILRRHVRLDVGMRQIDSLRMDLPGTLQDLDQLFAKSNDLIQRESEYLKDSRIDLIISDLPHLAFEAAQLSGIPAWGFSNFSWDWIYENYLGEFPAISQHIKRIRDAYYTAKGVFRLPFYGGFDTFKRIVDVPLVARKSKLNRQEIRHKLGIGEQQKMVLFSFGGHEFRTNVGKIPSDLILVSTDPQPNPGPPFMHLTDAQVATLNLRYCDLVAAADVVVSKPGYGIVSECIANQTAILYTPRGDFREYPMLVNEMKKYIPAVEIAMGDVSTGHWIVALKNLLAQDFPQTTTVDGLQVVTILILNELDELK
jgi:hypothetical protein